MRRLAIAVSLFVAATAGVPGLPSSVVEAAPPTPVLVGDINTDGFDSSPRDLTVVGADLYFTAEDRTHGRELWRFDGEQAHLVADIRPGTGDSFIQDVTAVETPDGPKLFFSADDGVHGRELWIADASGVTLVDVVPGPMTSQPRFFVAFDGAVFFSALTGGVRELYRYDVGTGTAAVFHDFPGSGNPYDLTVVTDSAPGGVDRLYLAATATGEGTELWYFEPGDTAPTLVDLRPGSSSSSPTGLVAMDGYLYALADDDGLGRDVFRVEPAVTKLAITNPVSPTRVGARLYLSGQGASGTELYTVADRSSATVDLVKDLNPGAASSFASPIAAVGPGPRLLFSANDGTGTGLWVTDGTEPGTLLVRAGFLIQTNSFYRSAISVGGRVFAVGRNGTTRDELWYFEQLPTPSDPNPVVPVRIELQPGLASEPRDLVALGSGPAGRLYTSAYTRATGQELFRIVPPAEPTDLPTFELAADVDDGTADSWAYGYAAVASGVFAAADTRATGYEPWLIAPVPGLLADIRPGPDWSAIGEVTTVGNRVVFSADDGVSGAEPWASDGTTPGTVRLADLNTSGSSDPKQFTVIEGVAVFTAFDGNTRRLFRTNGSTVTQLLDGANGFVAADELTGFRAGAVFRADQAAGDARLWWTDGTQAGTSPIAPALGAVDRIVAGRDTIYFTRELGGGVTELWSSDGTASGTVRRDVPAGVDSIEIGAVAGDRLYFTARQNGDTGMWAADTSGVRLLRQFDDDFGWGVPSDPTDVGPLPDGRLLFANREPNVAELWISDGTAPGTKPLAPNAQNPADPYAFEYLNGWTYFAGTTAAEGQEVWRSDGTVVEMIPATRPGPASSVNAWGDAIRAVGDRLYYLAEHPTFGLEPWYLDLTPPTPLAPVDVTATGGAAGTGQATVNWSASADVPGAPVTGYRATSTPGNRTCATTGATTCTMSGLTAGTSYRFTVVAINRIGDSAPSALSNAVTPAASPTTPPSGTPALQPLVPARLLETRSGPGLSTVDSKFLGGGVVGAGRVFELPVTGRGGVPLDASAVMLNVTAVRPSAAGYLTVFPCGDAVPNASSVNYVAGQVVPNAVLAKVGVGGKVCVFTFAETHLLVDVTAAL